MGLCFIFYWAGGGGNNSCVLGWGGDAGLHTEQRWQSKEAIGETEARSWGGSRVLCQRKGLLHPPQGCRGGSCAVLLPGLELCVLL